jgi:ribose transport system ATP-binding protein
MMEMLLELRDVRKEFPGVRALDSVDMDVARGEVHGLLGENGAGKSTLVKVIAGVYRRDGGTMVFDGAQRNFTSPSEASAAGITVIHQETSLIPTLSVLQNVFLGIEPSRAGVLDERRMRAEFDAVSQRLGFPLPAGRLARELRVAEQKMTEILKALVRKASLIIMDEPTDALADAEIAHLFRIIGDLRKDGITVLYITHYLGEVFRITDRITVLRDGRKVDTRATGEICTDDIVRMMIGQEIAEAGSERPAARRGAEAIRAEGLSRGKAVTGVSFTAFHGEILGIVGVLGSGKTELARLLFGADTPDAGCIFIHGRPVRIASPREAVRLDIGMMPEDRKSHGLVLAHEVYKNITIAALRRFTRGIFVSGSRERQASDQAVRQLGIRIARPDQAVRDLSGGNQQKVVIAKWLVAEKRLLIMDEPTRGIDVGAKAEIHRIMRQLADQGACVIFISAEVPEILRVADRILVMRNGKAAAEFIRGASQEEIIQCMLKGSDS